MEGVLKSNKECCTAHSMTRTIIQTVCTDTEKRDQQFEKTQQIQNTSFPQAVYCWCSQCFKVCPPCVDCVRLAVPVQNGEILSF